MLAKYEARTFSSVEFRLFIEGTKLSFAINLQVGDDTGSNGPSAFSFRIRLSSLTGFDSGKFGAQTVSEPYQ